MKEMVSTISRKGQVTVPADIRRHLRVRTGEQIAFVVGDDGKVEVRPARYTLESVLNALEALPNESIDLEQEIEEATAAETARIVRRLEQR